MTESALSRFLVIALVVVSAPATAAVTARGPGGEENPRAAWLDRYTEARQGGEQSERVTQTYNVGADGSLDLSNLSGDVRVTGGGGNEIRIEAIKRARHRDGGEAKQLLDRLRVEMNNVGGRVEVRAVYPRSTGRMSASVDFVISVPAGAAVSLKTISGNIAVSNVRGEVRADTVSGDLELSGTPNVLMGKAVSGTVTARNIAGANTVTLATISGNIVTSELKARALDANSVSGDVLLRGVQVERLEAKAVSGSIEFASPLARGGRYSFNSHSGDVRVAVLNGTGFELDATTFSGSVRSDFPITLRTDNDGRGGRGSDGRTIRGTFGDASAVLSVRSFSGSVVISKQ